METVPERVVRFLRNSAGAAYCDGCIQRSAGLLRMQQVQQITASLGLGEGFERRDGICSVCNEEKMVIRAN
jgi:hypothetical protein